MEFHTIDEGHGEPVLFIHAGVADSRMWNDQMGLDGYRTIAFDQQGFGNTPVGAEPYTDRGDALAILDAAGVDSAVVVGCSIGAGTAMELAIENPERVNKLILVGAYPSGWVPDGGFEDNSLEEEAEKAVEVGDLDRVVEIDYLMWLVGYGRTEADIDAAHKQLFFDMDRIAVQMEKERSRYIRHRDFKINDRLGEIDIPTLVMVGTHDESLSVQAAEYLAERLSDQAAVIVEGAAHLPSMEQPGTFNKVLSTFLTR